MVKISVIIPVYNVEKYLRQCLDSVTSQSLDDIEIICIDDGSTDASPEILKECQKDDSRIRIISQENKGAGASRNIGLNHACGEYVYFMDSDDYLQFDAFEKLNDFCIGKNPDFVMFKISNFNHETNELIDDDYYTMPYLKRRVGDDPFSYDDVSDFALELCVCPPGNLFNRQFLSDIRFPEGLLFEDNVFFTHALFKADRIYFYDEFLYNRRKRIDSTTAPLSIRSLDTIEISNLLLDLCSQFHHENHRGELYYRIFHNIYNIFKNADDSQKPLFFEKIKSDYLKSKDKWESDDYFVNNLKPQYKHIFNCAIQYNNWKKFEKCVDNFNKPSFRTKLKTLRKKIL